MPLIRRTDVTSLSLVPLAAVRTPKAALLFPGTRPLHSLARRRFLDIKNSFGEFVRTHRGIPEALKHLIQGPPPYDPKLRASPRLSKQCIGSLAAKIGRASCRQRDTR